MSLVARIRGHGTTLTSPGSVTAAVALTELHARLAMPFAGPSCSRQALTHRSFGAHHNERLEFIGDAVLNCAIAAGALRRFPQMTEGELSRVRASLVNSDTLARLARDARSRRSASGSARAS